MSRQRRQEGCPHPAGAGERWDISTIALAADLLLAIDHHDSQRVSTAARQDFGALRMEILVLLADSDLETKEHRLQDIRERLDSVMALEALAPVEEGDTYWDGDRRIMRMWTGTFWKDLS